MPPRSPTSHLHGDSGTTFSASRELPTPDMDASTSRPPSRHRRLLGWAGKALLSLGLVALLLYSVEWAQVSDSLAAAEPGFLLPALAVLAFTVPLAGERWRSSARAVGIELTHGFFLRATYAAVFAGQFLPAGVGVDAARIGFLWHQRLALRPALQSVFIDRIAGLGAIFLLMFGGLPFVFGLLPAQAVAPVAGIALLMLTGLAAGLLLDRLPFASRFGYGRIGQALALVRDTRRSLMTRAAALALAHAVALHVVSITTVLLITRAFGLALDYRDLLTVVSFAIFASLLPVSMNGWGVREGAMVLGLSLLAVNRETAVLISFLFGVGSALVALPGALSWQRMKPSH